MRTITFSNDQIEAVRYALTARIEYLESALEEMKLIQGNVQGHVMHFEDQLDVARQALESVQA